jgi:hypothetical protein
LRIRDIPAHFVRMLAIVVFFTIWSQFKFNLLLQIFDGLFTYHVLSLGVPEANPLVRDTISAWGAVWGLIYWKVLACALIGLIFALRHLRQGLTQKALTFTSTIYCGLFVVSIYHFLWALYV